MRCRRSPAAALASLIVPTVALALLPPARYHIDCGGATVAYESAVKRLQDALGTLQRCIEQSRGRDKCTAEMQALDEAHDNFEEAVADYTSACL